MGRYSWFDDRADKLRGGAGGGAVDSVNGHVGTVVLAASDVGAQPVSTDLAAIALLSTTIYGRALLTMADAAATRAALALGTAATADSTTFASASGTTTALAAKADLVGGLVPTNQIPALALTTSVVVASQAAMLALTTTQVQPGDLAIRTDGAGTFILTATDPTQLANWTRLNAPTDLVSSVNGSVGTVILAASDVGAQPVDSDLTAIAALTTTSFGRSFLALADAAAGRTLLGLGGAATLAVGTTAGTVAAGDDSRFTKTLPVLIRAVTVAYAATVTPNADTTDVLNIGALTGNITIANPTGTPVDGQVLRSRMSQDGTGSRTVSFGTAYAFGTDVTSSLIPSAASSKWEMLFIWNAADSKWRAGAIIRGF